MFFEHVSVLNSQSVLRNDVTSYCLGRWVWDLFWVEFVFFVIVLALGLLRISRSMLELEHIFELGNLYNLRFIESEICLPLFEYETQTEHKKTDSNLFIVTTYMYEFSVYWAQNSELSTDPCSRFLYGLGPWTPVCTVLTNTFQLVCREPLDNLTGTQPAAYTCTC